jgi:acyl-CoA synthetase (AMP-forming)/AMP-acid ligase II
VRDAWGVRPISPDLRERYAAEGHWDGRTLGQMAAQALAPQGGTGFRVRSEHRPWDGTLGDLDRAARSLAASLSARGVGPGDVVVMQLPNWVEAGITFFAATYLGAVIVPVVHFYGAKEVGYILDVTDPDVVVTTDAFGKASFLDMHAELLEDRKAEWFVVRQTDQPLPRHAQELATLLDAPPIAEVLTTDPDEPALIGFTSGTTTNPKGVVHSHHTIGFEARQLFQMTKRDQPPQITAAPVGHFIGMLNAFLCSLFREQPITLVDQWDPAKVLRIMRDEQLSMGGGATYFLTSLLDHPDFDPAVHLPLMPVAGLGGSAVPAAVMERAGKLGITAFRSYGSTEHPSITGSHPDEVEAKRHNTDGKPLPGVEIRLDDEGQILSRGPDLCLGYTDPELTKRAFDADGWYHTGDVGVLDDDGYLAIVDRIADVIIRGGENISALEVEDLMLTMPAIAEVAVVAAPDERLGERAAAVVRLREGATAPTLSELRAHLESVGLAKQKWPESIHVVADFPRTPSSKVQKFRLREDLRAGRLPATSE